MDLFELVERADACLKNNKTIDEGCITSLKNIISNNGYIGVAQINPIVGDIEYNAKKIAKYIKFSEQIGLNAIFFPELSLTGCSMDFAMLRHKIIAQNSTEWLKGLAKLTRNTTVIIGLANVVNNEYRSCIAKLQNGEIIDISSIFPQLTDEYAIITSCHNSDITEFMNKNCSKAKLLINCSVLTYKEHRKIMQNDAYSKVSSQYKIPMIHVNQVGANDNLLFEGISCVYNSNGELIARAKAFEEQLIIVNPSENIGKIYKLPEGYEENLKEQKSFLSSYENDMERTYKALVLGVKDYFNKCGIKKAVLGLSGGLDSTICSVILTEALGKENVLGVSMPSKITSKESKTDAEQLANNLGISFIEAPIGDMVDTTTNSFNKLFNKIETKWDCRYKKSYTQDNIQARSRATILWGISNEFSSCIPIATSDKSEAYMGYATINGDMSGGFAPIADITKTKLFALARWINKNYKTKNVIPESIILKKPGAELAIDPNTGKPLIAEDALMPYEFLDEVIWRIENKNETYEDMLKDTFIYETHNRISREQKIEWLNKFYKRMSTAFYKWSIAVPSVMIEQHSINKVDYKQLITSSHINYKRVSEDYINESLK